MRKLLGLVVLVVALPACATARSLGEMPAEALSDLGCTVQGVCSPVATVKPLATSPAAPVRSRKPLTPEERTLLERPPVELPSLRATPTTVGTTQPMRPTLWRPASSRSGGVGVHIPLDRDSLSFGPALEWATERDDDVVEQRFTLGLTLRF